MARLHLLRVFCGDDGSEGNPLGVFLDGAQVPPQQRQAIAADLGFSETVFLDDAATGALRIFTPTVELPFAGHPTVGISWLLAHEGRPLDVLRPPAGEVPVRYEDERSFVVGDASWPPQFHHDQLATAADVEAIDAPPPEHGLYAAWAWIDEPAGVVRARVFPVDAGMSEDEATGSAAVQLCSALGRAIDIRQGRGSRLLTRPVGNGCAEVGGATVLDDVRDYALPGA